MTLPRWLFSPLVVAWVAVELHAAGMAYALLRQEWDISGFVVLGRDTRWAADAAFDPVTRRVTPVGYDGHAYYAVARYPFADNRSRLDHPVRQARILYPLACFLASGGGDGRALVWVMPLMNLFAIGLMTGLAAGYARRCGMSAWWGLLYPVMVNAMVPAVRDLTDAFAMTAGLALVIAWERKWPPVAVGLVAAAAVLSREQNLAVVLVVSAAAVWERRWATAAALAVGVATLFAWMTYLFTLYGEWPVMPTDRNIAAPLEGIRTWYEFESRNEQEWLIRVVYAVFLAGCALILVWRLVRDRTPTVAAAVGWGGVALTLLAGPAIAEDYWSYSRALFWLPLGAWAVSVRAGCRPALAFGVVALAFNRGTLNVL